MSDENRNQMQPQEEEPVLNRIPFGMFQNQPNENQNQQQENQVGFFDSLTPSEVVDIGTYFFPSLLYVVLISIGLGLTQTLCSDSYGVIFKLMIIINSLCMARAVYHVVMIGVKAHEHPIGKQSFTISNYILYSLYYVGAIAAFIIFTKRPDICFRGKFYLKLFYLI